ncbi:MAG: hypothetical protein DRI48_10840, partial [Chloroflexi bacterium]
MKKLNFSRGASGRLTPLNLLFLTTGLLLLLALVWPQVTGTARGSDTVASAWQRAREAGVYRFSADIRQTTVPLPTVRNVGRASKTQTVHLEGETNIPNSQLHLTLWSQGGSVLTGAGGVEIKVEGDRAYARQGAQDWQEINDFTSLFAPQGDFMAFLSAARNVRVSESASQRVSGGESGVTRYVFDIDGRAYAAYMRDQLEQYLAEQGELPPGVELDLPKQYVHMTGQGELWVDAAGYPLRQILRLDFPATPNEQEIQAEITVDFSGFERVSESANRRIAHHTSRIMSHLPFIAAFALFLTLLITHSGSRKLYTTLAILLIVSMLFTPLLQSVQAADFAEKQTARAREAEARERESDMQRALGTILSESDHNPNLDPLAQHAIRNTDYPLLPASSSSSADSNNDDNTTDCDPDKLGDHDDDGLTDGNECVLGTNPDVADSDGDNISDGDEIAGFNYNGKMWYTDPLEMDTNSDGLGDGQEWNTGRAEGDTPPDTNGDGTPDLFDRDNDGDGVPDNLDLSPYYKGYTVFT